MFVLLNGSVTYLVGGCVPPLRCPKKGGETPLVGYVHIRLFESVKANQATHR